LQWGLIELDRELEAMDAEKSEEDAKSCGGWPQLDHEREIGF
jgi:hypothetical protein